MKYLAGNCAYVTLKHGVKTPYLLCISKSHKTAETQWPSCVFRIAGVGLTAEFTVFTVSLTSEKTRKRKPQTSSASFIIISR